MIGEVLSPYVITAPLGKGAMGEVFEARHQTLGKRVAIKLLSAALGEHPQSVERFFNEARAASAIEHRGIVEIIDVGNTPQGRPYVVMEFLRGESLRDRVTRGPLDVVASCRIVRQIASALAAAHARGIIHRDIKPDNVFLLRDPDMPGGERAKVLDFGIAKLLDAELAGGVATRSGAVIGTPIYMSPEQCGSEPVDGRADLYSLGCVLFELLSGRAPFVRKSMAEIVTAHLFEAPPPLPAHVPAETAAVVGRLLAKRPGDRFASASDVIVALGGEAPRPVLAPGGADIDPMAPTVAPSVTLDAGSSTLRSAAGQPVVPETSRSVARVASIAGGIAIAVILVGVTWRLSQPHAPKLAEPAVFDAAAVVLDLVPDAAPPPLVEIRFDSTPSADVIALGSRTVLCRTPCKLAVDRADGGSPTSRTFILRTDKHLDKEVTVDLAEPAPVIVALEPRSHPLPPSKRVASAAPAPAPTETTEPEEAATPEESTSTPPPDRMRIDPQDTIDPFYKPPVRSRETEMGYLVVYSQPMAKVLIDGKDTGKMTPIAPRDRVSLRPGPHKVTFVVGKESASYTVHIVAGETAKLTKELSFSGE